MTAGTRTRDAPPSREGVAREQSFARMLAVLRGRLWLLLLLGAPVLLLGGWVAASWPPAYTSQAVLTMSPEPAASADNSFLRLIPRYLATATSGRALAEAEARAGLPAGALRDSVTVENPTGTVEIALAVTAESADSARLAAGALVNAVVAAAVDDPLVRADRLSGPSEPRDTTPMRQVLVVVASVVLAVVPGTGLAFLLEGARPRIRVPEDIAALGIPVLPGVRRAALRRRRLRPVRKTTAGALARLRSELSALMSRQRGAALMVTAPSPRRAALVSRLTTALETTGEPSAVHEAGSRGLRITPVAYDRPVEGRPCVLVLPVGTPVDEAYDRVRQLRRFDARILGGVLVR